MPGSVRIGSHQHLDLPHECSDSRFPSPPGRHLAGPIAEAQDHDDGELGSQNGVNFLFPGHIQRPKLGHDFVPNCHRDGFRHLELLLLRLPVRHRNRDRGGGRGVALLYDIPLIPHPRHA